MREIDIKRKKHRRRNREIRRERYREKKRIEEGSLCFYEMKKTSNNSEFEGQTNGRFAS